MKRKTTNEKHGFFAELEKLGFVRYGECTFYGSTIKIFKTNKTKSNSNRYWQIQELGTLKNIYSSPHTSEILIYLSQNQFMTNGCIVKISVRQ